MVNAVGIDVSKGKSTVTVLQPAGVIVKKPFNVPHTASKLRELSGFIASLEGETRVVMECTGRYHEPVAHALHEKGIVVCVVNPIAIHNAGNGVSVRKTKTDRVDASVIASMLMHDNLLQPYTNTAFFAEEPAIIIFSLITSPSSII